MLVSKITVGKMCSCCFPNMATDNNAMPISILTKENRNDELVAYKWDVAANPDHCTLK